MNRSSARFEAVAFAFAAELVLVFAACFPASSGADTPLRAQARGAVTAIAEGVRAADEACADVATATHDAPLADRCAVDYRVSREALIAAEDALDASDAPGAGCAARPAVVALAGVARALNNAKRPLPPAVQDALVMAATLARLAPCPDGDRS